MASSRLRLTPLLSGMALALSALSGCAGGGIHGPSGPGGGTSVEKRISQSFPRAHLAQLPTPLEEMETVSARLGGPRILVKRDDQTGLATGGNKARKLEYILADAQTKGANVVITWGSLQSNWCRQTAAGAAALGMRAVLLLSKRDDSPVVVDGNHLLDELLGAEIHVLEPGTNQESVAEELAALERAAGNHPYVVSVGGSRTGGSMEEPLGAMGYITAFLETHHQALELGEEPDYMVFATGSGGTQAGLVVGAAVAGAKTKIVGISISGSAQDIKENVADIANQTARSLDLDFTFAASDMIVFDDYVGEGYGELTQGTVDAIRLVAQGEGILMDPVYTGKAMSGLMGLVESGYFHEDDLVVFLHTGGTPGLFHYGQALLEWWRP